MYAITHVRVCTPQEVLENQVVFIADGRVQRIAPAEGASLPPGGQVLEARGMTLAPGFIDIQFNGAFGMDFTAQPETIWPAAAGLPRYGVTAFLPTIVTAPLERSAQAQAVLQQGAPAGWHGASPLGLHIEGPFLNPEKKGAHDPQHLRLPDLVAAAGYVREQGVWLYTLAPELPGALELIQFLCGRGVVVSAGHSLATFEQARLAFAAGVRCGTHLFNAMPPLNHVQPGLVGALLADKAAYFGIIVDGIHVHPSLVRLAWQAGGKQRMILVTDAMAALGMPPGYYEMGGMEVIADGSSVRLTNGTLAGSVLSMDAAIRNLVAYTDCSLSEALTAATLTPARLLGADQELGQVLPGCRADLTLLDSELKVAATFIQGEPLYLAEGVRFSSL